MPNPEFEHYFHEIQSKVLKVAVVFLIGLVFGAVRNRWIISNLIAIFNLENINIVLVSPYQFINLAISISILCGIIFAGPLLIYEFLGFIRPALLPHEFRLITRLLPISIILFIAGFIFGVRILQFVIDIYVRTSQSFNIGNFWDIEAFLTQVVIMGTSMAVVFQLPILLTILLRLHVIERQQLTAQRKFVYAGLLIFDILLPPTDILSLSLIFIPLALLFEGTLLFNPEKSLYPIANPVK